MPQVRLRATKRATRMAPGHFRRIQWFLGTSAAMADGELTAERPVCPFAGRSCKKGDAPSVEAMSATPLVERGADTQTPGQWGKPSACVERSLLAGTVPARARLAGLTAGVPVTSTIAGSRSGATRSRKRIETMNHDTPPISGGSGPASLSRHEHARLSGMVVDARNT